MRAILTAPMSTIASQAGAECGNLCDKDWWETATAADVQTELDGGAEVMARSKWGQTPLHYAAVFGTPANIQALLAAGADVMARTKDGDTPLHDAVRCANVCASLLARKSRIMVLEGMPKECFTLAV